MRNPFRKIETALAVWLGCCAMLTAAQQAAPPNAELEAMGRALVQQMAAREFEKVVERFDETMTKVMPPPKMEEMWATLEKQAGAFQGITGTRMATAQGYRVVVVTCKFALTSLDTQIVLAADGRVTGLFFRPATTEAWKPAAYANADAFTEQAVKVGSGKWELPGTLTLPKGKGPFAAVVLVHGSGPQDRDESIGGNKVFKDLAWGLASRGIVVLRYEKRTRVHGKEIATQLASLTVNQETVDDAVTAVGMLAAMPEIKRKQIYVAGHSLGGMMAPRIAERAKKSAATTPLAGLVILAGTTRPLEEVVVGQVRYLAGLDGNVSEAEQKQIAEVEQFARDVRSPDLKPEATLRMIGAPIPGSYFLDLREYRPAEAAAKLKMPILVLQGERDYQVTMRDFEGWKKALARNRRATLKSYPTLTHLFIAGEGPSGPNEYARAGHVAEEVVRDIAEWVQSGGKKK